MNLAQYQGGHPAYPTEQYARTWEGALKKYEENESEENKKMKLQKAVFQRSYKDLNERAHELSGKAVDASREANMAGVGETASANRRAAIAHGKASMEHYDASIHPDTGVAAHYHYLMGMHHQNMERHHNVRITRDIAKIFS